MIRFCTYFDANYLVRGVTMCRSILRHSPNAEIWVLCLDDAVRVALQAIGLEGVRTIARSTLEAEDPELARTARTRGVIEYYFTATPSWCRYVLQQSAADDIVCYVDADVFFYTSPAAALDELGSGSILIMPHRFPPGSTAAERSGTYNVGLIGFRNTGTSHECIARWREQCLDRCNDAAVNGTFADQKYLDDWPRRFAGVVSSSRRGSCLAPWNFFQYRIATSDRSITVDGEPLIFYHFHGLTIFSPRFYDSGAREYGSAPRAIERFLYDNYMAELRATVTFLRERGVEVTLRDWIWRRRRRSIPAILRKLTRARLVGAR